MRRARVLASLASALLVAACSAGEAEVPPEPVTAEDGVVAITGTDRLRWSTEDISAEAGELTFELTCEPAVNHNLVIDREVVAECAPGETVTGTTTLEPGEHRFLCNVPGHERTMRGTVTVS